MNSMCNLESSSFLGPSHPTQFGAWWSRVILSSYKCQVEPIDI